MKHTTAAHSADQAARFALFACQLAVAWLVLAVVIALVLDTGLGG